ncbi:TRAP transporter substrate-binding protein DctP [Chloroflexota bacterium]
MKNKKLLALMGSISLVVILLVTSLLSGCGTKEAEVIELSYNQFFPPVHLIYNVHEYLADQMNKRTDGRVNITVYPTGTLTSGDKILDGTLAGMSNMGNIVPGWTPGRFPACEATAVPIDSKSGWVTTHVSTDFANEFKPEENDVFQLLFVAACGPYMLQTQKPVRTPADTAGLIARSSGDASKAFLDSLGIASKGMPMGEVYEAASKGVINSLLGPPETQKGFKHNEIFPYITVLPVLVATPDHIMVNNETWDSFPKDIQKAFLDAAPDMAEAYARTWWYIDIVGTEYALEMGTEFIEISEADKPQWLALTDGIAAKYIADKTAMGLPAAEYVRYAEERTEYYNNNHLSAEECKAWIEKEVLPFKD